MILVLDLPQPQLIHLLLTVTTVCYVYMYAGNSTTFCLCIVFNVGFKDIEVSINRGETANLIIQQIGNEIGGEDIGGFPEGQLVPLTFHPRTTFETFRKFSYVS